MRASTRLPIPATTKAADAPSRARHASMERRRSSPGDSRSGNGFMGAGWSSGMQAGRCPSLWFGFRTSARAAGDRGNGHCRKGERHPHSKESEMTQVSEIMTRGVRTLAPGETVMKAAQAMKELDVGVIPVCDGRKLLGMVTDRDIVLRGVANGCVVDQAQLKDVMTADTQWCYEDQTLEEVSRTDRKSTRLNSSH